MDSSAFSEYTDEIEKLKRMFKDLEALINENIAFEKNMLEEKKETGGMNTVGAGMCMGAIRAYERVLSQIIYLESGEE